MISKNREMILHMSLRRQKIALPPLKLVGLERFDTYEVRGGLGCVGDEKRWSTRLPPRAVRRL